jgi:hypothetical protein
MCSSLLSLFTFTVALLGSVCAGDVEEKKAGFFEGLLSSFYSFINDFVFKWAINLYPFFLILISYVPIATVVIAVVFVCITMLMEYGSGTLAEMDAYKRGYLGYIQFAGVIVIGSWLSVLLTFFVRIYRRDRGVFDSVLTPFRRGPTILTMLIGAGILFSLSKYCTLYKKEDAEVCLNPPFSGYFSVVAILHFQLFLISRAHKLLKDSKEDNLAQHLPRWAHSVYLRCRRPVPKKTD